MFYVCQLSRSLQGRQKSFPISSCQCWDHLLVLFMAFLLVTPSLLIKFFPPLESLHSFLPVLLTLAVAMEFSSFLETCSRVKGMAAP